MKKYITYILAFFVAVVAIDQTVGMVGDYMQHHSKPGPNKQFDDLCLNDVYDVLIMGSSRAHHHYVPQILEDSLELDVYNAGYDGNGVILSYGILQMILERYKPKCIIYDVEPAFDIDVYKPDNNRTRYLSLLKRYYRHKGVKIVLKDISWKTWIMSYSGIYRYNSVFLNSIREYLRGGTVFAKGYQPLTGEMQSETNKSEIGSKPILDSVKVSYLHRFIQCSKENDIKLILALSPKYGVENDRVQLFVHDLAEQYDIPIIDYYSDDYFQDNMKLFKEPMHLNNSGAMRYSSIIAYQLSGIMREKKRPNF